VEARDLHRFAAGLPRLRAIAFNGSTAARLGRRAIGATPLTLVDLPSSSPANTLGFERKRERWAALRELLID
jgi:double-stranded uracil-DNA glycosylase